MFMHDSSLLSVGMKRLNSGKLFFMDSFSGLNRLFDSVSGAESHDKKRNC